MNKKEIQKHRFALTVSLIMYIFGILLFSVLLSFLGVSVLISLNKIPFGVNGKPEAKSVLLVMSFAILIVGSFATGVTSHIVLKYVNRIINQMNRLASGDFKARLTYGKPLSNHPTFSEVTNSFNLMAEELEHTEVLRNDFINNFSHEFKTPIVSIAGFAKLLKYDDLTDRQRKEYLDIIEEEAMRLSAMATNVLNLSKVENQMILTELSTFNLSEQIRSIVLLLEKLWTKKNIEINLEFDEYEICASEELLKQIWINLIDNAIKFSPEYGEIVIKIINHDETYRVTIANTGNEIPKEKRKKIFEKFYQADESRSSEGNGIGLAIVKKVVDLHYGDISLECENGMTTFMIELPKDMNIHI